LPDLHFFRGTCAVWRLFICDLDDFQLAIARQALSVFLDGISVKFFFDFSNA